MNAELKLDCVKFVPGSRPQPAGREFRLIADWCEKNNYRTDVYGKGDLINDFEEKIARLLGFPAACFMPSGTMAQQIALKIYADKSGDKKFAIHPTSHLELHENHAYQHVSGLDSIFIGEEHRQLTAQDIAQSPSHFSTLIIELPAREIGGQMPSWQELEDIKRYVARNSIFLHMDGARLWETSCFYGKSYREICSGFDSVYVSFYKGIGALTGAMLLGTDEFIEQARIWLRRFGGNLFQLHPYVASAAMRFDRAIESMPKYLARTREVYQALKNNLSLRFLPAPPHVNMFHLYLESTPEKLTHARDTIAAADKIWVANQFRPGLIENTSFTEIYVGEGLLEIEDEELISAFAKLCDLSR